jgi:hypothetical protein
MLTFHCVSIFKHTHTNPSPCHLLLLGTPCITCIMHDVQPSAQRLNLCVGYQRPSNGPLYGRSEICLVGANPV